MIISLVIVVALIAAVYFFMQQEKFGRLPAGKRLELIRVSPQYRKGSFQNQNPTPSLTEGTSYPALLNEFFFKKKKDKNQPRFYLL